MQQKIYFSTANFRIKLIKLLRLSGFYIFACYLKYIFAITFYIALGILFFGIHWCLVPYRPDNETLEQEGQHTARGQQIFSFIIAFLTGIWPARHLKRLNVARGQK